MPSMNRVTLIGHLGKDAETRHTSSGSAVVSFSLATSRKGKVKGEYETDWHDITLWGEQAEDCDLKKGDLVMIPDGSIRYDKWTDRSGNKQRSVKIHTFQYIKGESKDRPQAPPIQHDDDVPF